MAPPNPNVSGTTLRTTQINPGLERNPERSCPICHVDYAASLSAPSGAVLTYCGHVFCRACITTWLTASARPTCPACRKEQFHRCGHLCLPRPLADHPPLASRPEERRLAGKCVRCWAAGSVPAGREEGSWRAEGRVQAVQLRVSAALGAVGPREREAVVERMRARQVRGWREERRRWEDGVGGVGRW